MATVDELRAEAEVLARFIVKKPAGPEHVERYVRAHDHVLTEPAPAGELAVVRAAARRPWLLPALDAAAALVKPGTLLHKKALLMASILEASPTFADDFLPPSRAPSALALAALVARTGIATAGQLAVGLPLLFWLERRG